jgi:hypothetical protein
MSCSNDRFKNAFANSVTSQMGEGFGGDFTSANETVASHWKDDDDDDDEDEGGGSGDEGN